MAVSRYELMPSEGRWLQELVNSLPKDVRERNKRAIREINRGSDRGTAAEHAERRQRARQAAAHPQAAK